MRVKISMDDAKYRINSMITIFSINAVHAFCDAFQSAVSPFANANLDDREITPFRPIYSMTKYDRNRNFFSHTNIKISVGHRGLCGNIGNTLSCGCHSDIMAEVSSWWWIRSVDRICFGE